MTESLLGGASAAPLSMRATAVAASAVVRAARQLFIDLERGRRIDAAVLRNAMEAAFGASDATGAWNWKSAYDACEAAIVLFLRRYGAAMRAKATSPAAMLAMLTRIANLLPSHTRRSEESESLQQFSTPIGLAFVANQAAAIIPTDVVLEPSAGTGLLAILAELAGASLVLNEFADSRGGILKHLFPGVPTTQFDAAHINDHLDAGIVPSVVLMNPPFSAAVHVDRKMADAALRHVASALARLPEVGRLVTITGANLAPDNPAWTDAFMRLQEHGRVVFSAAIDGAVYARHGTNIDTRLTVIDRVPAHDIAFFPTSRGLAPDLPTLLGWVLQDVPPRCPIFASTAAAVPASASLPTPQTTRAYVAQRPQATVAPAVDPMATEIAYESIDWTPSDGSNITDALYELYSTDHHNVADGLTTLPQDYAGVPHDGPRLGPALPGDLGRPIATVEGPSVPIGLDAEQQRANQETEAARTSKVFVSTTAPVAQPHAASQEAATKSAPSSDETFTQNGQDSKLLFVNAPVDRRTTAPDRLSRPASPFVIQAGTIIPAALITGIRSDLPGQISAQVTEAVFDSPTGRVKLVPQGARLIGVYDSQVAFGQSRVLLVWTRLIMPNGRSIVLQRQQGADAGGYSGLEDEIDNHWAELFKAALLSTILGVGAELGSGADTGSNTDIIQALRLSAANSLNQTGQQVVRRNLNIQPTLTIRSGFPVRVIVNRDLVLEPYRG